jgi:hypothetical protein
MIAIQLVSAEIARVTGKSGEIRITAIGARSHSSAERFGREELLNIVGALENALLPMVA